MAAREEVASRVAHPHIVPAVVQSECGGVLFVIVDPAPRAHEDAANRKISLVESEAEVNAPVLEEDHWRARPRQSEQPQDVPISCQNRMLSHVVALLSHVACECIGRGDGEGERDAEQQKEEERRQFQHCSCI